MTGKDFISATVIKQIVRNSIVKKETMMKGEREGAKCIRCGRKLTNIISVEYHAGAICRHKLMIVEAQRRQYNLFKEEINV